MQRRPLARQIAWKHRTHVAENYTEELTAAIAERFDGFDDVVPIDDDWDMAVDTNERQQVDEVHTETTVEDGDLSTEPGHLERMAQLRRPCSSVCGKCTTAWAIRVQLSSPVHFAMRQREEVVKCAERNECTRDHTACETLQRPTADGPVLRVVDDKNIRGASYG